VKQVKIMIERSIFIYFGRDLHYSMYSQHLLESVVGDLNNDLFRSEFESIGRSQTLDPIKPLPCDRWLALSAMQKSIRRGDGLNAQRALRTLYQHDPSSTWRRLLIIACEDVGIGALGAVVMTARRSANAKALREMGRDEAAALATAQMLAEAPNPVSLGLDYREPGDCRPPAQAFSHASTGSTDPDKIIAALRRVHQVADQQELRKSPAWPRLREIRG
jgi:hypothetical protein